MAKLFKFKKKKDKEIDYIQQNRENKLFKIQDTTLTYLEHIEHLIDNRHEMGLESKQLYQMLKLQLNRAHDEINKINLAFVEEKYTSQNMDYIDTSFNNNNNNNNNDFDGLSPSNNSGIDSDWEVLNNNNNLNNIHYIFDYEWCNENIENLLFQKHKFGNIKDIDIASSTYKPLIMISLCDKGKCHIWKLDILSKKYNIKMNNNSIRNQISLIDKDLNKIYKKDLHDINKFITNNNISKYKNKSKRNSKKFAKTLNKKYVKKELKFSLFHEIKLNSNFIMCACINSDATLIACGGLDKKVTIYDISDLFKIKSKQKVKNLENNNSNSKSTKKRRKSSLIEFTRKLSNGFKRNSENDLLNESKTKGNNNNNNDIINGIKNNNNNDDNKDNNDNNDRNIEIFCELKFWDDYISCIKFINDNQHILIGSGDGSVSVINYQLNMKIYTWKFNNNVMSVDYLYIDKNIQLKKDFKKSRNSKKDFMKAVLSTNNIVDEKKDETDQWLNDLIQQNNEVKYDDMDTWEPSSDSQDIEDMYPPKGWKPKKRVKRKKKSIKEYGPNAPFNPTNPNNNNNINGNSNDKQHQLGFLSNQYDKLATKYMDPELKADLINMYTPNKGSKPKTKPINMENAIAASQAKIYAQIMKQNSKRNMKQNNGNNNSSSPQMSQTNVSANSNASNISSHSTPRRSNYINIDIPPPPGPPPGASSSQSSLSSLRGNSKHTKRSSVINLIVDDIKDDIGDDSNDNDTDSSSSTDVEDIMNQLYNNNINKRNLILLVGCVGNKNTIFLDDFILKNDYNDDELIMNINPNDSNSKLKRKKKEIIKTVNDTNMKLCMSLNNKSCNYCEFSPNGQYFCVGGDACLYIIFDRITNKIIHKRYTDDNNDKIILNKKKIKSNNNNNNNNNISNDYIITCLTWINEYTVCVGNNKGNYIYISTIIQDRKIRRYLLKKYYLDITNNTKYFDDIHEIHHLIDNIIDIFLQYIGIDIVDSIIEVGFNAKLSCLASHPYFETIYNDINNDNNNNELNNKKKKKKSKKKSGESVEIMDYKDEFNFNKKEGLFIAGSWSKTLQGNVLKG